MELILKDIEERNLLHRLLGTILLRERIEFPMGSIKKWIKEDSPGLHFSLVESVDVVFETDKPERVIPFLPVAAVSYNVWKTLFFEGNNLGEQLVFQR